ncbi:quercetin dioxygenase-like cupin family protein [Catenulispora sp. GP43]|uniref:cupin domain-containing protein n=1 Tax=Catenulispora sp. GP43 TaxID=3156263 RepID=UPI003512E69C
MSDAIDSRARGFLLRPGEGVRLELPDWQMNVKVAASDTAGAATVVEGILAPGHPGPAPHVHDGHDECFIVLEGRMRFRVDEGFRTAAAGDTVFAGRGLAHGFGNPFAESARYVVLLTPSGYEDYFAEVAARIEQVGGRPDPEWSAALMARYATRPVEVLADPGERKFS